METVKVPKSWGCLVMVTWDNSCILCSRYMLKTVSVLSPQKVLAQVQASVNFLTASSLQRGLCDLSSFRHCRKLGCIPWAWSVTAKDGAERKNPSWSSTRIWGSAGTFNNCLSFSKSCSLGVASPLMTCLNRCFSLLPICT